MIESLMMARLPDREITDQMATEVIQDSGALEEGIGEEFALVEDQALWTGMHVLDLYAGSGALAIEALSRGAAWADLVEADSAVCKTIRDNLVYTKLISKARIHCLPVRKVLSDIYNRQLKAPFDVVLLDPPYADPAISEVLKTVASPTFIKPEGLMVVEHSRRVSLPDRFNSMYLVKSRRHGDTSVSIYAVE
jgi:16S rRNA (guanine966-N2)-methyltransferase